MVISLYLMFGCFWGNRNLTKLRTGDFDIGQNDSFCLVIFKAKFLFDSNQVPQSPSKIELRRRLTNKVQSMAERSINESLKLSSKEEI